MKASYSKFLRECAEIADDRAEKYGDIRENFERTSVLCKAMFGLDLTAVQVVQVLIAVKWAREKFRPSKDNRLDAANYTTILHSLINET